MSLPSESLEAQNITLRVAQPADAVYLCSWRDEPTVRQFQPLGTASLAQLRAELGRQSMTDLYRGQGDKFQWIVRFEDQPVGWITLVVTNWDHGLAEIGYALSTPYQGLGIMPQALTLLLAELFLRSKLDRIEARCATDNDRSQRVLQKLGFQREGHLRDYFVLRGKRVDNYLYAILRRDFLPDLQSQTSDS
jgi:RimJ/RimL family protein N-acetyltransferase